MFHHARNACRTRNLISRWRKYPFLRGVAKYSKSCCMTCNFAHKRPSDLRGCQGRRSPLLVRRRRLGTARAGAHAMSDGEREGRADEGACRSRARKAAERQVANATGPHDLTEFRGAPMTAIGRAGLRLVLAATCRLPDLFVGRLTVALQPLASRSATLRSGGLAAQKLELPATAYGAATGLAAKRRSLQDGHANEHRRT